MTLDIQSENIFTLVNKQILNHLRYFEKNIYWNDSWQSRLKQPAWSNLGFSVTAVCLLLSYFRILIVKKFFFFANNRKLFVQGQQGRVFRLSTMFIFQRHRRFSHYEVWNLQPKWRNDWSHQNWIFLRFGMVMLWSSNFVSKSLFCHTYVSARNLKENSFDNVSCFSLKRWTRGFYWNY